MRFSTIIPLATLAIVLGLSACGSQSTDTAATTEATQTVGAPSSKHTALGNPIDPVASTEVAASGDAVRGKGGLEEKCLAKVSEVTGADVIGTNRIDESEAATEIYVNVEGAEAPWKCLGYKDGTIGDVMYTGSEGAA